MPSVNPSAHQAAIRAARNSPQYRAARAEYRKTAAAMGLPCWLDGEPIDYDLPPEHPDSWSLDHAIPVSQDIALATDPNNFRSAHLDCNKRRGNKQPFIPIGIPSRDW